MSLVILPIFKCANINCGAHLTMFEISRMRKKASKWQYCVTCRSNFVYGRSVTKICPQCKTKFNPDKMNRLYCDVCSKGIHFHKIKLIRST